MPSDNEPQIITWVPQIFFDLIARVVPGIVTIGALVIASWGPSRALSFLGPWFRDPPESSPMILIVLLALTLSYALAIILWGIWYFMAGLLRSVRHAVGIEPETGVEDPKGEFAVQYDFIKKSDPQAGNRITKLKAEIHLAAALVVGLCISLLVDCAMAIEDFDAGRVVFGVLLVLALLGSASSWRFFVHRTETAVKNQCELLCYGEWCAGRHSAGTKRGGHVEVTVNPSVSARD